MHVTNTRGENTPNLCRRHSAAAPDLGASPNAVSGGPRSKVASPRGQAGFASLTLQARRSGLGCPLWPAPVAPGARPPRSCPSSRPRRRPGGWRAARVLVGAVEVVFYVRAHVIAPLHTSPSRERLSLATFPIAMAGSRPNSPAAGEDGRCLREVAGGQVPTVSGCAGATEGCPQPYQVVWIGCTSGDFLGVGASWQARNWV